MNERLNKKLVVRLEQCLQRESPWQPGDAVGRCEHVSVVDEGASTLVLDVVVVEVALCCEAQVGQPGELAEGGVLAAHDPRHGPDDTAGNRWRGQQSPFWVH